MDFAYQDYYTLEDYQQWQGDWELIAGMPYAMSPSPDVTHQTVSGNIFVQIKQALDKNETHCKPCHILMETDWQVANDTIVRPDIMVICKALDERVLVTPELVVEVVSPSSTKRDESMKFELYQQEGVLYYWLVYPEKRLAKVYRNGANGFQKTGDYQSESMVINLGEGNEACTLAVDFSTVWR